MSAEPAASAAPVGLSPPADAGVRATSSGPQVQVNEELWEGEDLVRHYAGRAALLDCLDLDGRRVQAGGQVRSAPELHYVARRLDVTR